MRRSKLGRLMGQPKRNLATERRKGGKVSRLHLVLQVMNS
jgi:hypothetical protein